MKLFGMTVRNAVLGLIVLATLIFLPAGTLAYWQGWTFIVVFMVSTNIIGLYLALRDPALLERRLHGGPRNETRPLQKFLISLAILISLALPVLSAFDHRFGWSAVPDGVAILGNVLVAVGLLATLPGLMVNSYSAATIRPMAGQTVITTGPYALVRHPMYAGTLVFVLGVPLALGSYWGLVLVAVTVPLLMLRILDEEQMLRENFKNYATYADKVRYRLVPGLW
jgi:protein-S-isoprenylcysteine O-methyltransferase Ste14